MQHREHPDKTYRILEKKAGWVQIELAGSIPDLPILPKSLLAMDLKSQTGYADLRAVAEIFREDPGAVARIFRSAACEIEEAEQRPSRLEDCISILGLQQCVAIMTGSEVVRPVVDAAIARTWDHAVQIARNCWAIADEAFPVMKPDDAYMVGLFHELGEFPVILHWKSVETDNPALLAIGIAEKYGLPGAVSQYFRELRAPETASVWRRVVDRAHSVNP